MGARTGGMPALRGLPMRQRTGVAVGATVASQLTTDRARIAADRFGNVFMKKARAMQCRDLVALLQGQVSIVHVQLHLLVKWRRLRHLARFSSRKLHFAV